MFSVSYTLRTVAEPLRQPSFWKSLLNLFSPDRGFEREEQRRAPVTTIYKRQYDTVEGGGGVVETNEGRVALLTKLIPQSIGMTRCRLVDPCTLPSGEICTEIVVSRYLDFEGKTGPRNDVAFFFGTGPTPAEQCDYHYYFGLSIEGEVVIINVPKSFIREGVRSSLFTPYTRETVGDELMDALIVRGDGFLSAACAALKFEVPDNHAVRRSLRIETSSRER